MQSARKVKKMDSGNEKRSSTNTAPTQDKYITILKRMKVDSLHHDVAKYLIDGNTITSLEAIQMFGATRLSGIIFNLRNEYGLPIIAEQVVVKNRKGKDVKVSRYSL